VVDATAAGDLIVGDDGVRRCAWGSDPSDYRAYHDDEWGRPVGDDVRLFEKLSLEGFQSGLSWLTILRKRPAFRRAFHGFDPESVARFGPRDVERLLDDASIVRHRGKIEATIANARATLEVQADRGSLAALVWSFEPRGRRRAPRGFADLAATTSESTALAKELRRYGFRFVGPTTAHAAMQSLGLVNDHLVGCASRARCAEARAAFASPAMEARA
jgi:DNA-3-methyladenine glycosylase I